MNTTTLAPTTIVSMSPVVDFDKLYRQHADEITQYARDLTNGTSIDPEDIMQETFLKAIENPTPGFPMSTRRWLFWIACDLANAAREKHQEEVDIVPMYRQKRRARRVA